MATIGSTGAPSTNTIYYDSGRNRQVRRMTARVGFPTLRLVRARIGGIDLEGLAPGAWREVDAPP